MEKGKGENWKYTILSDILRCRFSHLFDKKSIFFTSNSNSTIMKTLRYHPRELIKRAEILQKRSHFGYILAVRSTLTSVIVQLVVVTSPSLRSGFTVSLEKKTNKQTNKQHQSFSLCTNVHSPQIFSEGRRWLYTGVSHYHKSTWPFTVSVSQRQTYFVGKIWKLLQIRIEYFSHLSTAAFYVTELWSRGSVNPWQVPRVIKIIFPLTISAISIHNQKKESGDLKKWSPKGTCLDLSTNSLD